MYLWWVDYILIFISIWYLYYSLNLLFLRHFISLGSCMITEKLMYSLQKSVHSSITCVCACVCVCARVRRVKFSYTQTGLRLYITKYGLELAIFLPLSPVCWDCRCVLLCSDDWTQSVSVNARQTLCDLNYMSYCFKKQTCWFSVSVCVYYNNEN